MIVVSIECQETDICCPLIKYSGSAITVLKIIFDVHCYFISASELPTKTHILAKRMSSPDRLLNRQSWFFGPRGRT